MNFDFTPEQEAFRKEVRAWLEANLPDDLRGRAFASSRADVEEVRRLRAWQSARDGESAERFGSLNP